MNIIEIVFYENGKLNWKNFLNVSFSIFKRIKYKKKRNIKIKIFKAMNEFDIDIKRHVPDSQLFIPNFISIYSSTYLVVYRIVCS